MAGSSLCEEVLFYLRSMAPDFEFTATPGFGPRQPWLSLYACRRGNSDKTVEAQCRMEDLRKEGGQAILREFLGRARTEL